MDSAAGRVDSAAVMDSAKRTDSINATARSGWTEPSILGFAAAANTGEDPTRTARREKRQRTPKSKRTRGSWSPSIADCSPKEIDGRNSRSPRTPLRTPLAIS